MPSYYELIQVTPSSTEAEIEAAIDARYNQSRALVTHHDDTVRDQANQSLRMLEQIRATLTDPAKRAIYDEAIGIKGATAGVVDPTAILNMPSTTMTPPQPREVASAQKKAVAATAIWTCPKCTKENPPNTRFCFNCGTQLVRKCPECEQETSLVATGFCGNCGYNFDVATQRAKLKSEIAPADSQIVSATQELSEAQARKSNANVWLILGVLTLIIGCLATTAATLSSSGTPSSAFQIGGLGILLCVAPTFLFCIGAFVVGYRFSDKRKTDVENAQQKAASARRQRDSLKQRFDQLELRKTETH